MSQCGTTRPSPLLTTFFSKLVSANFFAFVSKMRQIFILHLGFHCHCCSPTIPMRTSRMFCVLSEKLSKRDRLSRGAFAADRQAVWRSGRSIPQPVSPEYHCPGRSRYKCVRRQGHLNKKTWLCGSVAPWLLTGPNLQQEAE